MDNMSYYLITKEIFFCWAICFPDFDSKILEICSILCGDFPTLYGIIKIAPPAPHIQAILNSIIPKSETLAT